MNNSLAEVHPELISEWSEKNLPLSVQFKEDGLVELIEDYNEKYGQDFTIPTFPKMKKDISARLAHKKPYERIANEPDKQIDLLIVVDQMLTGFDSKWINKLYMDKMLQYENIMLSEDITDTISFFESECTIEEFYWISSIFEDVIAKTHRIGSSNPFSFKAEWYLVSMAYNILKLYHKIQTGRLENHLFAQDMA